MSERIKIIPFNDMFTLTRGKIISKKTINERPGEYPVYSTQVDKPFGYIDSYMYDTDCLIWNTDGLGGYIRHVNGKFNITNIVGIMLFKPEYEIKREFIDLDFLKHILQPIFRNATKGRIGENGKNEYTKINSTMITQMNIQIPMPIGSNGNFDLCRQKEISSCYEMFERYRSSIQKKKQEIIDFNIAKIDGYTMVEKTLDEIFSNKRGNSKFIRTYMNDHKGIYPVYTATTQVASDFVDTYEYDFPQLTYVTDGYAGIVEIIEGKYTIGGHRAILSPKVDNLDLLYCKYALQPAMSQSYTEGSVPSIVWTNLKNNKILIPVTSTGNFDIEAQKEIAHKYAEIDRIKNSIINVLDEFLQYSIDFSNNLKQQ